MSRFRFPVPFAAAVLAVAVPLAAAAPVPKPSRLPDPGPNTNAVLKRFADKLTFTKSTDWPDWPAAKAFDGDPATSWFSASGDHAGAGKTPWVAAEFPTDATVSRVTVLGNREPQWPAGYFALSGRVELLDAAGKVLVKLDREAKGDHRDFDFVPAAPVARVRTVRFTATKDQNSAGESQTQCVGVAEIQVE